MKKKFFALEKGVEFYKEVEGLNFPYHVRDQILRASLSVVLNLSEGQMRYRKNDQVRFYRIAHASAHECLAALEISGLERSGTYGRCNFLGWVIWKLIKSRVANI